MKLWYEFLSNWAGSLAQRIVWLLDMHPQEWVLAGNWLIHKGDAEVANRNHLRVWVTSGAAHLHVELDCRRILVGSRFAPFADPDQAHVWLAVKAWMRAHNGHRDQLADTIAERRRREAIAKVEELLLRPRETRSISVPWHMETVEGQKTALQLESSANNEIAVPLPMIKVKVEDGDVLACKL